MTKDLVMRHLAAVLKEFFRHEVVVLRKQGSSDLVIRFADHVNCRYCGRRAEPAETCGGCGAPSELAS